MHTKMEAHWITATASGNLVISLCEWHHRDDHQDDFKLKFIQCQVGTAAGVAAVPWRPVAACWLNLPKSSPLPPLRRSRTVTTSYQIPAWAGICSRLKGLKVWAPLHTCKEQRSQEAK